MASTMAGRRGGADDAVRITTATLDPGEDLRRRQRRYLYSMSLRTLCFVGGLVTTGVLQGVLFAGAIFLPYVAVVLANAASKRTDDFVLTPVAPANRELGPGTGPGAAQQDRWHRPEGMPD